MTIYAPLFIWIYYIVLEKSSKLHAFAILSEVRYHFFEESFTKSNQSKSIPVQIKIKFGWSPNTFGVLRPCYISIDAKFLLKTLLKHFLRFLVLFPSSHESFERWSFNQATMEIFTTVVQDVTFCKKEFTNNMHFKICMMQSLYKYSNKV